MGRGKEKVFLYGISLTEEQETPFLLLANEKANRYVAVSLMPGEASLLIDEFYYGPSTESRLMELTLDLLSESGAKPAGLIIHGSRKNGFYSEMLCSGARSAISLGVFEGIHMAFRSGIEIWADQDSLEEEDSEGMPPVHHLPPADHFISFVEQ